jgi:hypothetical protein
MNKRLDLIFKYGNRYKLDLTRLLEALIIKDTKIILKNKNIKEYIIKEIKLTVSYENYYSGSGNFIYYYIFDIAYNKPQLDIKYFIFLLNNGCYFLGNYLSLIGYSTHIYQNEYIHYQELVVSTYKKLCNMINNPYIFNNKLIKLLKHILYTNKTHYNEDIIEILNFCYLYTTCKIKFKWPKNNIKMMYLKNNNDEPRSFLFSDAIFYTYNYLFYKLKKINIRQTYRSLFI